MNRGIQRGTLIHNLLALSFQLAVADAARNPDMLAALREADADVGNFRDDD